MKKIVCLIAMALFTATGCTSVEMNQTKTDTPDDNTQGNATTLSCADYTLNPLWNWAETPANQLIVIRSQAELADFIFPNDKLPEDIDFEKNTLLLVAGQATNGIESVKKNFVKAEWLQDQAFEAEDISVAHVGKLLLETDGAIRTV